MSIELGSLSAGAFAVYELDGGDVIEADLWGEYGLELTPVFAAFLGAAYYNFLLFEDDGSAYRDGTPELYGGIALGVPLNPTLTVAHDFDLGDGTHATLSVSDSYPLGSTPLSVDLGADLDYNHGYYVDIDGFAYADFWVSLGIGLGPLTLSPIALFQFGIDDSTYFDEPNYPDEQVFGVTASVTF